MRKAMDAPPISTLLFLTRKEAAKALRMSLATLDRRIAHGDLKAKKHGRATLVLPEEITRYLENLPDIEPRADGAR
jgi:excisionase family DNA binding protein